MSALPEAALWLALAAVAAFMLVATGEDSADRRRRAVEWRWFNRSDVDEKPG